MFWYNDIFVGVFIDQEYLRLIDILEDLHNCGAFFMD